MKSWQQYFTKWKSLFGKAYFLDYQPTMITIITSALRFR